VRESERGESDIFMFRFNREIQILSSYFVNQILVWIGVRLSGLI
jgi:hypothetical protein